jgi:hypothetical protein
MAWLYLDNTVDIIDYLGGNAKVAAMLDTSAKAVGNWRYSGMFPADTYLALQKALKKNKAEAPDTLWPMKMLQKIKR